MPLILALREAQIGLCELKGQPDLQNEFQDSQSTTKKPCLGKQNKKQEKNRKM